MMATRAFEADIDACLPVNGDNLANAMRAIKNWDTGGLIDVPVSIAGQQVSLRTDHQMEQEQQLGSHAADRLDEG